MKNKNLWVMFFLIIAVVVIDQWTKHIVHTSFFLGESIPVIEGFFNLTYVRNSGAAFGFGGAFSDELRYVLFLGLPVVACIWLLILLYKSVQTKTHLMSWAYALILGGAIGNLIDRFQLDYVVDFFDFYQGTYHFATFNVADAAISIAAGLLVIDFLIQSVKKKEIVETVKE